MKKYLLTGLVIVLAAVFAVWVFRDESNHHVDTAEVALARRGASEELIKWVDTKVSKLTRSSLGNFAVPTGPLPSSYQITDSSFDYDLVGMPKTAYNKLWVIFGMDGNAKAFYVGTYRKGVLVIIDEQFEPKATGVAIRHGRIIIYANK